jgi:hypothetical protein
MGGPILDAPKLLKKLGASLSDLRARPIERGLLASKERAFQATVAHLLAYLPTK